MAERKSQNKYYPPDWDPSKGSVNKYVGQHPLRDRARKIKQGILVIRFEMPYNIWCGGCNSHIGMGVRYNAEKKKVGNYYSTPIWQFRMKCHLCDNYFEIQTDPKNHDYVILSGARRKEQRWDPKENEQIETEDKAVQRKMATDAMFKLEHGSDDKKKGKATIISLGDMEEKMSPLKDDYMLNKLARQKFRNEKKALKKKELEDKELLSRTSLDIPLMEETPEDIHLAGLLKYSSTQTYDEKQELKRKEIEKRPLFETTTAHSISKHDQSKLELLQKGKSSPLLSRGFPTVTFTSKTLSMNDKLLGIRKRTARKNDLSKSRSTSSGQSKPEEQDRSEKEGNMEVYGETEMTLNTAEAVERLNKSDPGGIDCVDLQQEEKCQTRSQEKESFSGLGLVSAYSDSDSDDAYKSSND